MPDKIMINTHPQRWDDRFGPWVKELVWQNVKNVIKRYLLKFRNLGIELATKLRSASYARQADPRRKRQRSEDRCQPPTHPPYSRTVAAGSYVVPRKSEVRR